MEANASFGRFYNVCADTLVFDALNISTVAGVDAHLVAGVAEEGHTNFGAGLHGSGLEGVGGGIALDAGFGVGDFEHNAGGHLAGEDSLGSGVYHGFADVTFFEELYALDAFAGDCYLLESLGVHEVVAHVVFVEELVGATLNAHFFYFHARVPGLFEDTAGLYVAELGADESRALAGLHVKEFDDEEVVAVDVEAHTVFKVSCCCHKGVYVLIFICVR